jgi:uncharacterized membrane protein
MRIGRKLKGAAAAFFVAAYAGLSHFCNAGAAATAPAAISRRLGAALALGPLTIVALMLIWRGVPRPVAVLLTAILAGLIYRAWPTLEHNFPLVSLVEDSGVYLLLGTTFGRSLFPGHVALCTALADRVHGPLSALEISYTRRVTAVWASFFYIVAALSISLFVFAPLRIWSVYVNFCVLPLIAMMFVAEYGVRSRVLPRNPRGGLLATVRVYFAAQ